VRRPKVSEDSATVGLTANELDRLLTAAETHSARSAALVSLLVYNGLRIAEVLACDVESFTHQRGHRVLRIVRKGGKASTEPLSPIVLRALEAYIGERAAGPLFLNTDGAKRLSYSIAYKPHPSPRPPGRHRRSRQDQPPQPAPLLRHRAARRRRTAARRAGRHGPRGPPHHPGLRSIPPQP
jgi:integrase